MRNIIIIIYLNHTIIGQQIYIPLIQKKIDIFMKIKEIDVGEYI